MQPLRVNDAAEASNESCSLLLNLCVHPEVSHEVDVADPAGGGRVEVRVRWEFLLSTLQSVKGQYFKIKMGQCAIFLFFF